MTPLSAILSWWEKLGDFPREFIAAEVCVRLIPHSDWKDAESLFRNFVSEELPANWHVGRVIATRSVIDFWFWCDQQSRNSTSLLDAVEEGDVQLKSLANAALGRRPKVIAETDSAHESWKKLCATTISDASLIAAERETMLRYVRGIISD